MVRNFSPGSVPAAGSHSSSCSSRAVHSAWCMNVFSPGFLRPPPWSLNSDLSSNSLRLNTSCTFSLYNRSVRHSFAGTVLGCGGGLRA